MNPNQPAPKSKAVVPAAAPVNPAKKHEATPQQIEAKTYVDRLLLRIFNTSPGASAYLHDHALLEKDGKFTVQLVFDLLPAQIITALTKLFGGEAPPKVYKFTQDSHEKVAISCDITPEMMKEIDDDPDYIVKAKDGEPVEPKNDGAPGHAEQPSK